MKTLCTLLSVLWLSSAEAQFSNISPSDLQSALKELNIPENELLSPGAVIDDQFTMIELRNVPFLQEIDILSPIEIGLLSNEALIDYILNVAPFEDPLQDEESGAENARLVAALLALSLGPFGVHRMYLGTELRVPVFYTLTLGGGLGILPLIDFFYIIFSKEDVLKENGKIFMWGL